MSPSRWFPILSEESLARTQDAPQRLDLERPGKSPSRRLGFDVRGDPGGQPCFWFHGSPGGRLEGLLLDDLGRARGHRFIVADRPGLGASDPCPEWTMMSFAQDILDLADHLGLDRFSVAGGSGGGPFVLALAAMAPRRIDHAVSLACAGAFELPRLRRSIGWVDAAAARAAPYSRLLDAYFTLLGLVARCPEGLARCAGRCLTLEGGEGLAVLFLRTLKESTKMGPFGLRRDTQVLHQPWGFDLGEIPIPVTLVNGTRDGFVPLAYGAALAEQIPQARLIEAPGDDHFRTIFDLRRLDALLRA